MKVIKNLNLYHLTTLISSGALILVAATEINSILEIALPDMVLGAVSVLVWLWILRSSIKNGRNWRAKKDSRNSITTGITGDPSGTTVARPYSRKASARKSPGVGRLIHNRLSYTGKRLPVSRDGMPILAKRGANIWYDAEGSKGMCLVSLNGRIPFGVDADAVCTKASAAHITAPHTHCDCGFYAVTGDGHLQNGDVVLLVELSGVVIEHSHGYRAQHQRVLEVQLNECLVGHHKSEYLVINRQQYRHACSTAVASCEAHLPAITATFAKYAVFSKRTLSEKLGVPVTNR